MKKFFNKSTLVVISVLLISMLIAGCSNQSAQTPDLQRGTKRRTSRG